jgi:4-amino-4-deoxy-L-arabinose transferase-like glycosyltransferase
MKHILLFLLAAFVLVALFFSTIETWIDWMVVVFAGFSAFTLLGVNYYFIAEDARSWRKKRKS